MPPRRVQIPTAPARASSHHSEPPSTLPAHHPFDQIPQLKKPHPLAAILSRLLAALSVSPISLSAAVAASRDSPAALAHLHAFAVSSGLDAFLPVSNSLVASYAKSGAFALAHRLFAAARRRDVVTYNSLLSGFTDGAEALAFLSWMLRTGGRPDGVTFTQALSFSADLRDFGSVRQMHARISRTGFAADVFVGNALITAYSRGGFLGEAQRVFDEMPSRDLVSWNALICGLAQEGDGGLEAIQMFLQMLRGDGRVRPDRISVVSIIPACGDEGMVGVGRQIHCFVIKLGVEGHVSVSNVLISMYYKCRALGCARKVFENMDERDVITWTTMMSMDAEDAVPLFNGMRQDGIHPNDVTFVALIVALPSDHPVREGQMIHGVCFETGISGAVNVSNSLITMYAKLQTMEDARKIFDCLVDREIVTWNALIAGYAQNELCEDALEAFSSMASCLKPNEYTFASILSAVTTEQTVSLSYGQMCHCQIVKLGLNTGKYAPGALTDMYAKRGGIDESQKAFDETAHRSVIGWTAIIQAHAKHGNYGAVMSLFKDMVSSGVTPDHVALLAVLTACGFKGMVDAGRRIFDSMVVEYGVEPSPEHYACMVDMLGRAGRLTEAEELIRQMPAGPGISALQSLLGACRIHGNMEIGRRVAELLTEMEPAESGAYVLLSNIYADKGEWENVAKVRRAMREKGVKKEIGFSWVDVGVDDPLHKFSSDDMTHPLSEEIYRVAEGLGSEMKFLKNGFQTEM